MQVLNKVKTQNKHEAAAEIPLTLTGEHQGLSRGAEVNMSAVLMYLSQQIMLQHTLQVYIEAMT